MNSPTPSPPDVGVILVAAGRGERMGGTPKQFRELAGIPVLLWALRPFLAHPAVGPVVVALPAPEAADPPSWLAELASGRLRLVEGGQERADSVRAGLRALPGSAEVVLVHDGVRPFPEPAVIEAVIAAARHGRSAVAALPVSDTLKRARALPEGDFPAVEATVARERLWRAQTPQGFPRAVLEHAFDTPATAQPTDDAAMVEALGQSPLLVPDSPFNLKLTTPDDLRLAELIARDRRHAAVSD